MKTLKNILIILLIVGGVCAYFVIDKKGQDIQHLEEKIKACETTINKQADIIANINLQLIKSKDSIKQLKEKEKDIKYVYIEKEKELEVLEPEEQIAKFDENTGDYEPTKLIEDSLALTPLPRIKNANRAFLSNVYLSERVDIKSDLLVQYELAISMYEDKIAAGDEIQQEQSKIIELKEQIINNMESECRRKRIIAYCIAGGAIILVLLIA